jgi:AcrR family transcriptional regulator
MRSAAQVFAERGLQGATIDEIATRAGFTKGAFYANFASKEDLFLTMLDERFAARLGKVAELSRRDSKVEQQAQAAGEYLARYLAVDPDWQQLFFEFVTHAIRDEAFRGELVRRYGDLRAGYAELFARRAAELGVTPPVPVERIAQMTFAMANGFALERLLEPDIATDELYGEMLAVFFAGLRALTLKQMREERPPEDRRQAGEA